MKYYRINYSGNSEIIGNVDCAVKGFVRPFNIPMQNFYGIYHGEELKKAVLPNIRLEKAAKWVDYFPTYFMDNTFKVISKKMIETIHGFKKSDFLAVPVQLIHENESRSYFAIHFNEDKTDLFINWAETICKIKLEDGSTNLQKFKDYNDFIQVFRDSRVEDIKINTLSINFDFDFDFFFVSIPLSSIGIYCSEKLKNVLKKDEFVGVEFVEIQSIYVS